MKRWPKWLVYPSMLLKAFVLVGVFALVVRSNFSVSALMYPEDLISLFVFAWIMSAIVMGFYQWHYKKFESKFSVRLGLAANAASKSLCIGEGLLALFVLPLGLLIDLFIVFPLTNGVISLIAGDFWAIALPTVFSVAYLYHGWLLFWIELQKEQEKQRLKQELKACTLSDRELRRLQKAKVKITRRRYRRGKPRPADPIAMELNQIRKDLGLH